MNKKLIAVDLTENSIETMIYEIRGERVMLDSDLAKIYGYETNRFNEQVKNNAEKFPKDFMFQISKEEWQTILKSKKSTSSWGGTRKMPYVFTEQGIYMLMTVLKGELATEQSKTLIRLFKRMKSIKEQKFPSLFLRYEKRSGWASIATDSSKDTISNDNCGVKK